MRTYNVYVDFISEDGAVLYSRTFPIIAESALMAEMGQDVTSPADFENVPF